MRRQDRGVYFTRNVVVVHELCLIQHVACMSLVKLGLPAAAFPVPLLVARIG